MARLEHHQLTWDEKVEIADWHYEGEYSCYDVPTIQDQQKLGIFFADPKCDRNLYAFTLDGNLMGFTNIREDGDMVFFGIGTKPDFCGKGYGEEMVTTSREIARKLYPGKDMYLDVRVWNKRAIRCYEKCGFRIVGDEFYELTLSGPGMFYRMISKY